MARCIAFFALFLGAAADVSVSELEKTAKSLDKYLDSFEKRDLSDPMVYAEYKGVREAAKQTAAMLEVRRAKEEPKAVELKAEGTQELEMEAEETGPSAEEADEIADESKMNLVEEEVPWELKRNLKEEYKEYATAPAKKEKTEEKKEDKEEETEETEYDNGSPYKGKKGHKKKKLNLYTLTPEAVEKLRKFQSPYKTASKLPEPKEVEVIDEGEGTYGKFKDKILGYSLLEKGNPKNSLLQSEDPRYGRVTIEDTIAQREKELKDSTIRHLKAEKLAERAHSMCGVENKKCNKLVQQKLESGFYDNYLKERELRDTKTRERALEKPANQTSTQSFKQNLIKKK